ncbi:lipase I [Coprinopsis marcescibilis]|uniref:Carboxylic ester hydrolase n=1 Tax=Coprinopsis marcescibilis TaxID=230819 RepID=A0A5C3KXD7_COPMA|nr:lipase I [Coprinopsis marcescibilis]
MTVIQYALDPRGIQAPTSGGLSGVYKDLGLQKAWILLQPIVSMILNVAVFLAGVLSGAVASPRVTIGETAIVGRDIKPSNVDFFGGIPFAEPPVGALRFKSPVLKTTLNGSTFDASNYGKSCLQPPFLTTDVSEDCLSINIHRPAGMHHDSKLPVLFWTYGGGYVIGTGSFYNGSEIVAHSIRRGTPVIYVNFNYRLGPLGFPSGKEAFNRRELNLGVKDVLAALEWVHANIAAFGGDKDKVTIFGQSGGAVTIGILYFHSEFERLVRGAIFESGQANTASAFTATERESRWQGFVRNVTSCSAVATSGNTFPCLQNASEEEISTSYLGSLGRTFDPMLWGPVIDSGGKGLLPDFPSKLYKKGKFARIPFIAGTTLDEGTFFSQAARNPAFNENILKAVVIGLASPPLVPPAVISNVTDNILKLYPDIPALGSPFGTGDELFGFPSIYKRTSALQGDMGFVGTRRQWMETAAIKYGVKGYGYMFSQQPIKDFADGVRHDSEFYYVYGVPPDQSPPALQLSSTMMDYWISFAVNLDPNDDKGSQRPIWPLYSGSTPTLLQFEAENITAIPDDFRKQQIDYMNANALVFRR